MKHFLSEEKISFMISKVSTSSFKLIKTETPLLAWMNKLIINNLG